MREASKKRGALILACDYPPGTASVKSKTQKAISSSRDHICAIKLNFHLLLSLNLSQIRAVNSAAHRIGACSIADIKLNDIGNTNAVTLERLENMGFDAVIANPIMGKKALAALVLRAHRRRMGIISLCHMSAPEARQAYEMAIGSGKRRLYEIFLDWAAAAKVDGIVVGATYPEIISKCARKHPRLPIYSPGVGVQGGSPRMVFDAGAKYVIAGRSLINSADPGRVAGNMLDR